MEIEDAQREVRFRFAGGFYGQLISSVLWFTSAALATWSSPRLAISTLVIGGFFIFPATELLLRFAQGGGRLSAANSFHSLGMQVAFVLPFSMLLLVPITRDHLHLFYPALMILLGAHYIPFVFLYGMRLYAGLAAVLLGGGVVLATTGPHSFSAGAWVTGTALLILAAGGYATVSREIRSGRVDEPPE